MGVIICQLHILIPGLRSRIIFTWLWPLNFFQSGSGSWFFSQAAPTSAQVYFQAAPAPTPWGQKHAAPCGSDSWLLVTVWQNIFLSTNYKCKTARNIEQVKYIIFQAATAPAPRGQNYPAPCGSASQPWHTQRSFSDNLGSLLHIYIYTMDYIYKSADDDHTTAN